MKKLFTVFFLLLMVACKPDGGAIKPEAPELSRISIQVNGVSSSRLDLTVGEAASFTATAYFSDNTQKNVTNDVSWSTTSSSVASIARNGGLSALSAGNTHITASLDGVTSNRVLVSVTDKVTLTDISVSFVSAPTVNSNGQYELEIGDSASLRATATYSDNTQADVTGQVNWRTTDSSVVAFNGSTLSALSDGVANIGASLDGVASNILSVVVAPQVSLTHVELELVPTQVANSNGQYELTMGESFTLRAMAHYSDNTEVDVTASSQFSSSDASVGALNGNRLSGLSEGLTNISATYNGEVSNSLPVLVVSNVTLTQVKLDITPAVAPNTNGEYELNIGESFTFNVTAVYSDNSEVDVTAQSQFTSNSLSFGNLTSNSFLAMAAGKTTITANFDGMTSNGLVVSVLEPVTLTQIAIELVSAPATNTNGEYELTIGSNFVLKAIGTYSDNSTKDITDEVNWSSSNNAFASITNNALAGIAEGLTNITATLDSITSNNLMVLVVPNVTLTDIAIEFVPAQTVNTNGEYELTIGNSFTLQATGTYSDSTTKDITTEVTWASSNTAFASITNSTLKGIAEGLTNITASLDSITSNELIVSVIPEVTLTDIAIEFVSLQDTNDQSQYEVIIGDNFALKATGTYSDSSTKDITTEVTWNSSNAIAGIVTNGSFGGLAEGLTNITATLDSITSNELTVSVIPEVTLTDISIEFVPTQTTNTNGEYELTIGNTFILQATGTYSDSTTKDITTEVTWVSSNATFASITNSTLTGIAEGLTNITASLDSITSNELIVSVIPEVTLTDIAIEFVSLQDTNDQSQYEVIIGDNFVLKATGTYSDSSTKDITNEVTWNSSNAIAGIVTNGSFGGLAEGLTNITATLDSITSNELIVSVIPELTLTDITIEFVPVQTTNANGEYELTLGNSFTLQATGTYSDSSTKDITTEVTWDSSNTAFASITNGTLLGITEGLTNITASLDSITSNELVVSVIPDVVLSSVKIEFDPAQPTNTAGQYELTINNSFNLKATAIYSDNSEVDVTSTAVWSSSNEAAATISGTSLSTIAEGLTNIIATFDSMQSNALSVLVVPEVTLTDITIEFNPAQNANTSGQYELGIGNSFMLKATGTYSDSTTKVITDEVTWSSSNTTFASITNSTLTGIAEGLTTVSASLESITSNELIVSVIPEVTLTDIAIEFVSLQDTNDQSQYEVIIGDNFALKATGTYSDSSTKDITTEVTWNSSNAIAGIVTNGSFGGLAEGFTNITATLDSITSNELVVSVIPEVTLTDIAIEFVPTQTANSNGEYELTLGNSFTLQATGTYSDSSTKDITSEVTWSSSNTTFASITNSTLTGIAEGLTNITASLDSITSNELVVFVIPDVVLSSVKIEFDPVQPTNTAGQYELTINNSFNLKATAIYSDNSEVDVTSTAVWSSSNEAAATISGTSLSTIAEGLTNITATFDSMQSNALSVLVVPEVTLTDITIEFNPAQNTNTSGQYELGIGNSFMLKATGTYSDSSTKDITTEVTWDSSNTAFASITNSTLTGITEGLTNITASLDSIISNELLVSVLSEVSLTSIRISFMPTPNTNESGLYELGINGTYTLKATAIYSDDSEKDVTTEVTWNSSDTSIAAISENSLSALAEGQANIDASYEGIESNILAVLVIDEVTLTDLRIEVDPPQTTHADEDYYLLLVGSEMSFKATAVYSDGSEKDVTTEVTWQKAEHYGGFIDEYDNHAEFSDTDPNTLVGLEAMFYDQLQAETGEPEPYVNVTAQLDETTSNELHIWVTDIVELEVGIVSVYDPAERQYIYERDGVGELKTNEAGHYVIDRRYEVSFAIIGKRYDRYSDETVEDYYFTTWQYSDEKMIYGNMESGEIQFNYAGLLDVTANGSINGMKVEGSLRLFVVEPEVERIEIEWENRSYNQITSHTDPNSESNDKIYALYIGHSVELIAMAYYTDGTSEDIADKVRWNDSGNNVLFEGSKITGNIAGQTQITASYQVVESEPLDLSISNMYVAGGSNINLYNKPLYVTEVTANIDKVINMNVDESFILSTQGIVIPTDINYIDPDDYDENDYIHYQIIKDQLTDVIQMETVANYGEEDRSYAALKTDGTIVTWGKKLGIDADDLSDITSATKLLSYQIGTSNRYRGFIALNSNGGVQSLGYTPPSRTNSDYGGVYNSPWVTNWRNVKDVVTNSSLIFGIKDGETGNWFDPRYYTTYNPYNPPSTQDSVFLDIEADGSFDNVVNITVSKDSYFTSWVTEDGSVISSSAGVCGQDGLKTYAPAYSTNIGHIVHHTDYSVSYCGANVSQLMDRQLLEQISGVETIVASAYGYAFLTQDKEVKTWGVETMMDSPEWGVDDQPYPTGADSSAVADELINVEQVVANTAAFAALREDGTVVTWGSALYGGENEEVKQLTDVVYLYANNEAFVALKADGTAFMWGHRYTDSEAEDVAELKRIKSVYATDYGFYFSLE